MLHVLVYFSSQALFLTSFITAVCCVYAGRKGDRGEGEIEREIWRRGGRRRRRRRRRREHATECPKPLEQGIFLVD